MNNRLKNGKKSSSLFLVDTGVETTFSGSGSCLDEFRAKRKLKSYSGYDDEPSLFYDRNYDTATIRFMQFDQAFHKVVPYDCRESK